jgi:HemK-related putative methylase
MKSFEIFKIKNQKIKIQMNPLVFHPSPHGTKALGENIAVFKGERVLDIGTGTGILAILAAKLGGKVLAVDILQKAVNLAKQNALLNKVDAEVIKSNLFEKVPAQKFDVIIANVPQEVLSPKILSKYPKEIITGMHGFGDGSRILTKTLKKASTFMKSTTRLYVVVYSMSGWRGSLNYIIKNYNVKLLDFYSGEVKDFVYKDLNWYKNNSKIGIYKVGKKYWADLFIFELYLKN